LFSFSFNNFRLNQRALKRMLLTSLTIDKDAA
jgi:hypothetical protein